MSIGDDLIELICLAMTGLGSSGRGEHGGATKRRESCCITRLGDLDDRAVRMVNYGNFPFR